MIVTVQIVFCLLKEAFQSLLFRYREGHSDSVDHVERLEELTKTKLEGGQLKIISEFKTVQFENFFQHPFATLS